MSVKTRQIQCGHCSHVFKDHDFDKTPPGEPDTCGCSQCPDGWCRRPLITRKSA